MNSYRLPTINISYHYYFYYYYYYSFIIIIIINLYFFTIIGIFGKSFNSFVEMMSSLGMGEKGSSFTIEIAANVAETNNRQRSNYSSYRLFYPFCKLIELFKFIA